MNAAVTAVDGRDPAVIGALVGVAGAVFAVGLLQASPVWIALVAFGLVVFVTSFIVDDARMYWLAWYLATIPISIAKLFFWTPDDVALIKRTYGLYVNETMVPQIYVADLPFAMLLAMSVGEVLARRRRIVVPKPLLLIIAFLAWCAWGIVRERAPLLGASWFVYEVKLVVVFLWFVNAGLDRRAAMRAVNVLLLSLLLQSSVVFYTYVAQTGEDIWHGLFGARQSVSETRSMPTRGSGAAYVLEDSALKRGTGTVGTANLEAKYFVLLLPLALVTAVCGARPRQRAGGALVLAVGLAALYLTYSRGGLLTAGIALALVLLLLTRAGLWRRRTLAVTAVAGIALLAAIAPQVISVLGSRPTYTQTRIDHLVDGLQIFREHPFVGVGLNNFNVAVSPIAFDGTFAGSPIHNHYLRIAIETGLPGFLLYFGFFAWALGRAYGLTRSPDRFVAALAIALFAGLAATAVYWLDDVFYDPIVRTQTCVMVALVAVLSQISSRGEMRSAAA